MGAPTSTSRERLILDSSSKPQLKRFMRLRRDETRDQWVLLAPEKILTPDDLAVIILKMCDGEQTLETIVSDLAKQYDAPVETIRSDVTEMLQALADKGYLSA